MEEDHRAQKEQRIAAHLEKIAKCLQCANHLSIRTVWGTDDLCRAHPKSEEERERLELREAENFQGYHPPEVPIFSPPTPISYLCGIPSQAKIYNRCRDVVEDCKNYEPRKLTGIKKLISIFSP